MKAEVKPTDPKPQPLPEFDISRYNLASSQGVKEAAHAFIAVLTAHPQAERPGVFLGSSGMTMLEAMRSNGLSLDVKKIEALGISIPPVGANSSQSTAA